MRDRAGLLILPRWGMETGDGPCVLLARDAAAGPLERAYGVMVLALRGDRIAGITGFPRDTDLFARLGLPVELTPER